MPQQTAEAVKTKDIPHKDFAKRMAQACDGNLDVPLPNRGRLQWFVDRLQDFHVNSTPETVRKWLGGESLPRPKAMRALAELLKVDEAWLSLGKAAELDVREQKVRNANADGVVNVVAGFIQMGGANPAFPVAGDKRAENEHIDIYAIIRGAQYAFHVALAVEQDGEWRFAVPVGAENTLILGVAPIGPLAIEIIEIDPDNLKAHGTRKGGHTELKVNKHYEVDGYQFKRITKFNERL